MVIFQYQLSSPFYLTLGLYIQPMSCQPNKLVSHSLNRFLSKQMDLCSIHSMNYQIYRWAADHSLGNVEQMGCVKQTIQNSNKLLPCHQDSFTSLVMPINLHSYIPQSLNLLRQAGFLDSQISTIKLFAIDLNQAFAMNFLRLGLYH